MAPPQGAIERSRKCSSRHHSKNNDHGSASAWRSYHGSLRQEHIDKTPNPVVPVPKEKLRADGEPVEIRGKSNSKGKKSNGKSEKVSKNKDIKAEPHSDREAPRVKVSPSECPVTKERLDRKGKTSDKKSGKASRSKDIEADPHSDWEAPRVKVSPSECPVTQERSEKGMKNKGKASEKKSGKE